MSAKRIQGGLASLLLLLLMTATTAYGQNSQNQGSNLFSEPSGQADALPPARGYSRQRVASINTNVLRQADQTGTSKIELNLFADTHYVGTVDRMQVNGSGSRSYVGHMDGVDYSSMTLVEKDGVLIGHVVSPQGNFVIGYNPDGTHTIGEIDQAQVPVDAEPRLVKTLNEFADDPQFYSDDGSRVDVLVAYTDDTVTAAGSEVAVQNTIDLAITESNDSFTNSGINFIFRLVHTVMVTYDEIAGSALYGTALDHVTQTAGHPDDPSGLLDNVHTLRDTHDADVVVLLIEDAAFESCGLAWVPSTISASNSGLGFSVTRRDVCATGNFTFGHEIGHNMLALHDRAAVGTNHTVLDYNYGYKDTPNDFRTIMGTSDSKTRIQYWSNPSVNSPPGFGSAPTGIASTESNSADNHMTLNMTVSAIANYQEETSTATLTITNAATATPNPVESEATASLAVTATHSQGSTVSYAWTASCTNLSNGAFDNASTQNPMWTAPKNELGSAQTCTLEVTASAGGLMTQSSVEVTVNAAVFPAAQVVSAFPPSQKVVAPYWQSDTVSNTFLSVSHPSFMGMNSQIGVSISAVLRDGQSLYGPPAEFTINSGESQQVFISYLNNPSANPMTNPNAMFIIGTSTTSNGAVVVNPIASHPHSLLGPPSAPGRGYPDITQLSFWGAIVVQGTFTGFAMEFIGDSNDSRTVNTPYFSGVN